MAGLERRERSGVVRWRVRWREDGKWQSASFNDEKEALKFKARVEVYGNHWPPGEDLRPTIKPSGITFGEWALEAVEMRTRATDRTKHDYRRAIETHMRSLTPLRVDEINDKHVARWIGEMRALEMSDKTIRNIHGIASSVMADAMRHRPPLAEHNPFAGKLGAEGSDEQRRAVEFLTPEELDSILVWVLPEYVSLVRFLFATGLRYGEATALTVRDVDLLGRKTITVNKAWKRIGSSGWRVGAPKTPKANRTIPIAPDVVELLIPLVSGRRGDELLFTVNGGRLPHAEFYKRGWAPAVARANVCDEHAQQLNKRGKPKRVLDPCDCLGTLGKRPGVHALRHSHASMLIAAGVPLAAISKRLGHASINVTVDTYGHLDASMDEAINDAVQAALSRRSRPAATQPDSGARPQPHA